jgi:hypothetical protein
VLKSLAVSAAIGLAALGTGGGAYSQLQEIRTRELDAYKLAIDELRSPVAELEETKRKLRILEAFQNDPTKALAVLDLIGEYPKMPDRVTLVSINFTKGEQVVLQGHARETTDISEFRDYLTASKMFSEVRTLDQTLQERLRGRPKVYVFRINCKVPEFSPDEQRRNEERESSPSAPVPAAAPPGSLETKA